MKKTLSIFMFGLLFQTASGLTIPGDSADTCMGVDINGTPFLRSASEEMLTLGDNNAQYKKADMCAVVVFQLPDLGGQSVSNADVSVYMTCSYPGGSDPFPKGVDLYGVRYSATPTVTVGDYGFKGSGSGTLLQQNVMEMPSNLSNISGTYETDASGNAALAMWLNEQYAAGAQAGHYVFLRYEVNGDTANRIDLASADNTTYNTPVLTVDLGGEPPPPSTNSTVISQYGISWTMDGAVEYGQYASGDYWVIGPVSIIDISNGYHTDGPLPVNGQDGSMVNPGTDTKQGYDNRLTSYEAALNAGLPNGSPVSESNPLALNVNESLISQVSWLVGESGCPGINGGTGAPRPVTRAAAILTCVSNAPPAGSFRPPYCGTDKEPHFNVSQLDQSKLGNLDPVSGAPALEDVEAAFARPWIDHVYQYLGAMVHPSLNMPEYGQRISQQIGEGALMLQLDFSQLPGSPSKDTLLKGFTQVGIDLAGVADNGGGWPSNGGHHMGRKFPILFAGTVLNDVHMLSAGSWSTEFQEDLDTFYVSQAEIDITQGPTWNPDNRADELWPYTTNNIGLPEWGIRHTVDPWADQLHWSATYRSINYNAYPGWVLAAHIMGLRDEWDHQPLFDYMDRSTSMDHPEYDPEVSLYKYAANVFGGYFPYYMWQAYRPNYPPQWVPYTTDPYSLGELVGVFDSDGDGIPDAWETVYFGGATNANPSALAANGVNTIYESYVAGLDPTNAVSRLTVSNVWNTVQWNSVSGRIYSVWWTTNLLSGFQPLETNIVWPQNSWTDSVNNAAGGFYRLDVQLAP